MSAIKTRTAPVRHPWLAALVAAPETEVRALVAGVADIHPYSRAEPADAAASLLFGLPNDDPAVRALDAGCLAVLEQQRRDVIGAPEARWLPRLLRLDQIFDVVLRMRPMRTVADLHARYAYWFNLVETAVIDDGLDLRRAYWRVLALTQAMAPRVQPSRHLMPLWLEICGEAGDRGRYRDDDLEVGLLGLRRLPLGPQQDGNEEAVCQGLARWAAQQMPDRSVFDARWAEIGAAYPHSRDYWQSLVERVIATAEDHLAEQNNRQIIRFAAADWWREAVGLALPQVGQRTPQPRGRASVEPAPLALIQALLRDIVQPISAWRPKLDHLMGIQRRYTDTTGDAYYLLRTACNVGMRMLEAGTDLPRAEAAEGLARFALSHEPMHHFAWMLWRDAVAARGATAAAEAIGWETIRRFPEDPQKRCQMATLLADQRGRPEEALALLQETRILFPLEVAIRPQLAQLLADRLDRVDEARIVLEEALEVLPDNPHTYGDLAALLADRLHDHAGAAAVLRLELQRFPGDPIAQTMTVSLNAGRTLRPVPSRVAMAPADSLDDEHIDLPAARLRRALFRAEAMNDGDAARTEIARLLAEDPALGYARWVDLRIGGTGSATRPDTGFAFAFARAARAGSPAAFEALIQDIPSGLDHFVARAGLTLITGGTSFTLPNAANDRAAGPLMQQFTTLLSGISRSLPRVAGDPRRQISLLSDFVGGSLSRERLVA